MTKLLPTILAMSAFLIPTMAHAEEAALLIKPAPFNIEAFDYTTARPATSYEQQRNAQALRAWKRSVVPLVISQSLDVASSYGMRELNPMLAGPDGRFGAKALTIKAGTTAAIVGVEYLIAKKWPGAASLLSKLNWASSALTGAFAVHNYSIK
jgi:hypothetical protein